MLNPLIRTPLIAEGISPEARLMPVFLYRRAHLTAHQRVAERPDITDELAALERLTLQAGTGEVQGRFTRPISPPGHAP